MVSIQMLIVEDSDDDVLLIVRQLRRGGIELTYETVQTAQTMAQALAARPPQLVICDYNLPSFNARDALVVLHDSGLDVPFILVSGNVGEEVAAALMKAGAHDFVLKHRLARLAPAVERELREAQERRRSCLVEAALQDSEERFRLLAEHIQDVIFRYRLLPEAGIDYISPAVTTVTGYTPDEVRANPDLFFAMVEPEDRTRFERSWHDPNPPALVVRWRRRDGRLVWMEQRAVGVCDGDGQLIAVEGILRDVTEQALADQERDRLDRELRQSERLDSLGQLAGGVAHDFNNLLAVITGYAGEVMADLPEDHPSRPDIEQITHAAAKAASLTRQLLIFSRLEPSQPQTLNVNDVVTEIERLLRRTIGEDIEFLTLLQPDLSPVTIDRTKIEQVVVNLVVNARAAMPDGGQLRIMTNDQYGAAASPGADTTVQPGRQVCLTITDTGHGMPPDVAERVFEPFFTTKGPGHGTGLGLATAYGVVTEAGGTITLDSRENHGTTFTVLLPAADHAAPSPAVPSQVMLRGAGQTILVVEDDEAVRAVVQRILTKAGYHVLQAATPKDAIEMVDIRAVPIDGMLTDVIMPEMSGPQLVERVRNTRPDLPVLLMSGYTADSFPGGHDMTADLHLIRKPFSAAVLLQHIQELVATSTTSSP
jgi:PAS domain S-box-containing protein